MRQELNELELDQVVGGVVVVSDKGRIGFKTTGERYHLANCTWLEARAFVEGLLDEHPEMENAQFDAFAKAQLQAKGWLGAAY